MIYILSCVWLDYMVQYFQHKNCGGSSPTDKKCTASFLVPGYKYRQFAFCGLTLFFVNGFDRSGVRKQSSAPAVGNPRPMGFVLLLKSDTRAGDERVKRA